MSILNLYINDFNKIRQLYKYNPKSQASFLQRAKTLDSVRFTNRRKLVDILVEYNKHLGCDNSTISNLDKLSALGTLAVVTGQQAGLFTGPLYTIYKACTAILLANQLGQQLNRWVVPVFWVASEDHDFQEINHIFLPNEKGKPNKLSIERQPIGKPSIGDIQLPQDWEKLIRGLSYHTPESSFKAEVLATISEAAKLSENLGEWFARLMVKLFKPYGLIFIDPMLPGIRGLFKEALETTLDSQEAINEALLSNQSHFEELGLTLPISKDEKGTSLFLYYNRERLPLLSEDTSSFYLKGAERAQFSKEELLRLVKQEPNRFSPNVVLRPIFQDLILPNLAYVAGPGEIAYYGQISGVYRIFGLEMPIIYPRKQLTIIDAKNGILMKSHGLDFNKVSEMEEILLNRLKETMPIDLDAKIAGCRVRIQEEYNNLLNRLALIDPVLQQVGKDNWYRLENQLTYLRNKAWQKHRKAEKQLIKDFERIKSFIRPFEKPQERVYNVTPFLVECGFQLINLLVERLDISNFDHQVIVLGDEVSNEFC